MSYTKSELDVIESTKDNLEVLSKYVDDPKLKITIKQLNQKLYPDPKFFGKEEVVGLRKKFGLSQVAFARVIACSLSSVRQWERGERRPDKPYRLLMQMIEKSGLSVFQR